MKKFLMGIVFLAVVFTGYLFLFSRFFPFSPVIIGFTRHELSKSIIYIQKNCEFVEFLEIDTLITSVENFHELKFKAKPKVFIYTDSFTYVRTSSSKARFCAFPNGRIFVSPWALREACEGKISMIIYVKHELSHVLINQYNGLLNAIRYPKWLLEGIAVYSANQLGTSIYPDKTETYQAIANGNFLSPLDFRTSREDKIKLDVRNRAAFMYSEFGCIVDFMVLKFGKPKFLEYMKCLIKSGNEEKVFNQVFGTDFNSFINAFKNYAAGIDKINHNQLINN